MEPRTAVYHSAADFDDKVWAAFRQNEGAANLLYPFAQRALSAPPAGNQHWVAYFEAAQVTYVVSCTTGDLGPLPVFIYTVKSIQQREQEGVNRPLCMLAVALHGIVERERLFSVFAPQDISLKFSEIWTGLTAINTEITPYYDSIFTFCTKDSFVKSSCLRDLPRGVDAVIGRGEMCHINQIAEHCHAFSKESVSNTSCSKTLCSHTKIFRNPICSITTKH